MPCPVAFWAGSIVARKRRSWREWQHPRDERGRFTSGRGSRRWAERALAGFGMANPAAMSMSAGSIREGAPSGRIDLGALVRENAAFHAPRQLTQNVSAGKMGGMTSPQTAPKAGDIVTFGDGTRSARVVRVGASNKEGNPGVVVQTDDGYEHTVRAKDLRAADASAFRLASLHDLRAHKGKQVDLQLAGDGASTRVQVVSFGKVDGQPAVKVRQKVYDRDARGYVMRERVYRQDQVAGFTVVDTAAEKSIGNPTGGGDARSERSARSIERGLRSGAVKRK